VHVYENGVGAINLPYTAAQTGAHGTRAMHPVTLRSAEALFGQVLDHKLAISNPSLYRTKADMCSALPDELDTTIGLTESCDTAFAYRGSGASSCGRCTSCLLRRQSLWAAGLQRLDDSAQYREDAFTCSDPSALELYEFRAMLSQAAKLRLLTGAPAPERWSQLVREFPDLVRVLGALSADSVGQPRQSLVDMLSRYVQEWAAVPSPLVGSYLDRAKAAA